MGVIGVNVLPEAPHTAIPRHGSIRQVEHKLVQPEDGPVQAIAAVEGLQDRAVSCFLPGMDDANARVDGDAGRWLSRHRRAVSCCWCAPRSAFRGAARPGSPAGSPPATPSSSGPPAGTARCASGAQPPKPAAPCTCTSTTACCAPPGQPGPPVPGGARTTARTGPTSSGPSPRSPPGADAASSSVTAAWPRTRLAQAPHRRGQPAHPAQPRPHPLRRRLGPGHLTRRPDPARRPALREGRPAPGSGRSQTAASPRSTDAYQKRAQFSRLLEPVADRADQQVGVEAAEDPSGVAPLQSPLYYGR